MTTKEQELKALAQIKKIVDGLGEDSYREKADYYKALRTRIAKARQ